MRMHESLGPLEDGATVVVVGGGPGGAGCAIALKRLSREIGRSIDVVLYEAKSFAGFPHYNQCIGVLSPPADRILEDSFGVAFPRHLVQRRITGYTLHGSNRQIVLDGGHEVSHALRRVEFDNYLLNQARLQGVRVIQSRVTDLEFCIDRVRVFSESDNREAAVIVGAFGLDEGTATMIGRILKYRGPEVLTTIVTKIHPGPEAMAGFGSRIHAFLPSEPKIEFGAVTPKGNHVSINIAGKDTDVGMMKGFLALKAVRDVLPHGSLAPEVLDGLAYFKGRFPISLAKRYCGDRYVFIGDAAGLVRAFKGKGINSACESGIWAAEVILRHGISGAAFAEYYRARCREILQDIPYGRAVRRVVAIARRAGAMDSLLSAAEAEPAFQAALFDAVSGNRSYRDIIRSLLHARVTGRIVTEWLRATTRHRFPGAEAPDRAIERRSKS